MSQEHKRRNELEHYHNNSEPKGGSEAEALDPANKALIEALRLCFIVLKVIMICVIGLFIYSGAYKVEQNELAVELRFGKLKGMGVKAINQPGWHWAFPYPIEEVIKIPASTAVRELNVDSFWYYQTEQEKVNPKPSMGGQTLQFVRDGYSLTASRSVAEATDYLLTEAGISPAVVSTAVTDYNVVHSRWRIRYFISEPIAFVAELWDGTTDEITSGNGWYAVEQFLQSVLSDAINITSASRDIEWMIWENPRQFKDEVEDRLKHKLEGLNVGMTAKLELLEIKTPRQVKAAFDLAASASLEAKKLLNEAQAGYNEIINQSDSDARLLIASAQAYKENVVQAAKADSEYLEEVLGKINKTVEEKVPASEPEWQKKRQQVFAELLGVTVDELYQETIREVVGQAAEVFVPTADGGQPMEWRIYLSRDPTIKPERGEAKETGSVGD